MRGAIRVATLVACGLLVAACATGEGGSGGVYTGFYYDDPWYGYGGGGCCIDYPDDIGPPPPRPEHPIAKPPTPRPSHPIATPPSRPMPSPRPAAMSRGGGRR